MKNAATILLTALVALVAIMAYSKHVLKHRGAGDTLAATLQAVGIEKKPWCKCEERHTELNRLIPY